MNLVFPGITMIEQIARASQPLLQIPVIRRTRRNHGLEHATITILSGRLRGLRMAGRSDAGGYVLLGDIPTDSVEQAAHDALQRLRNGEPKLAIHPNCGTNLVTTALLTSVAAMVGLTGADRRAWFARLPLVMALVIVAGILSQPLGLSLQRHITTDGDPGDLEIKDITRHQVTMPFSSKPMIMHRVNTRSA
ncbi:MAG: hypothetical protein IH587_00015 [Anaerolineae bacterium]|nr:hypothetical protein [Anaerolineae bacterium]